MAGSATSQSWRHLSSARGELPAPTGTGQQSCCVVADFDGDGTDDIVVGGRYAGAKVELWRRSGNNWIREVIEPVDVSCEAGGAVMDVDRDGDLDLIIGQDWLGNEIYWWENPRPNFGSPWTRRTIKNFGGNDHHDQAVGDVDGDGRDEFLSWCAGDNALYLFEVPSDPRNSSRWPSQVLHNTNGVLSEGLAIADIDLDGVDDVVGGGRWWRHQGGGTYAESIIDVRMAFSRVAVGQLIAGGRPEVVFTPGDVTGNGYWYQWTGSSWTRTLLDYFHNGHTLAIADLNGDGALDIFSGEMQLASPNCEVRIYHGTGVGVFNKQVLSTGNDIHEGRLGDVDGDGDLDLVHKPLDHGTPRLEVWLNPGGGGGRLDRWTTHVLDANPGAIALFVLHGDVDGDGRIDVIAGDSVYLNPGQASGAFTRRAVGGTFRTAVAVHDFDGDGDLDLLGSQSPPPNADPNLVWAENQGNGVFVVHANISRAEGDFLQGVAIARFRGPGQPLEVALSWHQGGNGVQMLTVPANPAAQTWSWRRISTANQEEDLSAGDIDGDGDLDLALGTIWLENPSWTAHTLGTVSDLTGVGGTPMPDRNELADIDGDGDLDLVVGLESGRELLWFVNPRPQQPPTGSWTRRILGTFEGQGFSVDAADIDRDGDIDVTLGEHRGTTTNRMLVLENDGSTGNWPVHVVDTQPAGNADHHDGGRLVDIDGDGDLDILSTGWLVPRLWLFENLGGGGSGGGLPSPLISPDGGTFRLERHVAMATPARPTATIRYTLDGSEPTSTSPTYSRPFPVRAGVTVKAKAFESGQQPSRTAVGQFAPISAGFGHWRFDSVSPAICWDDSVAQRNGTVIGPVREPGRLGLALRFDGRDDRVELGSFDIPGSAMSIAAWVKINRVDHLAFQDARFISKARSVVENDHTWMLSSIGVNNQPFLRFRLKTNGATSTLIASGAALPLNRWVHVAATYDGATMRVWQDGVEVGSLAKSGPIAQEPGVPVWVGDNPAQGGRPFDGAIDDLRLFSRVLSRQELMALASDADLPGVVHFGRSTRACGAEMRVHSSAGTEPRPSRYRIGLICADAPPSTVGVLLLGTGVTARLSIANVDLFLDPGRVVAAAPVASSTAGTCEVPISVAGLPRGAMVAGQYVWLNPNGCGPVGQLSASDAIALIGL